MDEYVPQTMYTLDMLEEEAREQEKRKKEIERESP